MGDRPYDITVYGASGFTGQYAAIEAVKAAEDGKRVAVAGRNKAKLEKVLDFVRTELGNVDSLKSVGIIIADSNSNDSVNEMCRQSKCIVNCVGPFRFYGEQIVRACVEMGTNYVDISGEPEFLQSMQLKYHDEAKKKGVHIVGACGFDSIPADFGLEILRDRFPGELTAAESYIHFWGAGKANYGTYFTIIHSVKSKDNVKNQQKAIFKEKLPYTGPRLQFRGPGFSNSENRWFVPFLGADPSVVKRTQLYEFENYEKTPVQYAAYLTMGSLLHIVCGMLFALSIFVLTKFSYGIKILETYPRLFSFGIFSKDGVSPEDLKRSGFKVVFHGKGYSKKPESHTTSEKPDKSLSLVFSGPECGYIFTSAAVVCAAVTLLDDKLQNSGGVLTPASALRDTKYLDRLMKRGVNITVI